MADSITIKITADTSEFESKLDSTTSNAQSSFSSFENAGTAALKAVTEAITKATTSMDSLNTSITSASTEFKTGFDQANTSIANTADTASTAESQLDTAVESTQSSFSTLKSVGTTALKAVTAAITTATTAMTALGTAVISVGTEFETAFAQVETIMDTTAVSVEDMEEAILTASSELGIAASELSTSVYNAISATGDTANAVSLVTQAAELATAGFTDTESALSVLTTAINSYGLETTEAESISDSLIATQNLGVTTIDELSSSMGRAIASASAYGVDLYNLESAYVSLTKGGISTYQSTTYLSSMLSELGDTSSDVAEVLQEQTGQSFAELMDAGYSLADVIGILYESVDEDSTALMNLWSSQEAGKASNAIVNQGLEEFNENLETITNSAGSTEEAYETMCDTVSHQTDLLKTNLQNLGIAIYDSWEGSISDLAALGNEWVEALAAGFDANGMDGLISAFSAVLPQVVSKLGTMLEGVGTSLQKYLPSIVSGLMGAVPSLLSSLGGLIPDITSALFSGLAAVVENLIIMLPDLLPIILDGVTELAYSVLEGVVDIFGGVITGAQELLKDVGVISESIDDVVAGLLTTDGDATITLTADIDASVDTSDAYTALQTEFSELQETLNGYGLDTSFITDNINASYEEIYNAALDLGLSEEEATIVAEQLTQFNEDLKTAASELNMDAGEVIAQLVTDSLGAAFDSLQETIDGYGLDTSFIVTNLGSSYDEIKDAAMETGLSEADATVVAEQLSAFNEDVRTAVEGINLDYADEIVDILSDESNQTEQAVADALEALGLSDAEVEATLEVWRSFSGSMTERIGECFTQIEDALTDGAPDTEEVLEDLREGLENVFTDVDWGIDEYIDSLDIDNSEYSALVAEAEADKETLEELVTAANAWIEAMAGQSTEYVQENLAALEEIEAQILAITEKYTEAEASITSAGEGAFNLIRAGGIGDAETVDLAFTFAYNENATNTQEIQDAWDAALAELYSTFGENVDTAEAQAQLDTLNAEYEALMAQAQADYEQNITDLFTGLAEATMSAEEQADLSELADKLSILDAIDAAFAAADEEDRTVVAEDFSAEMQALISEALESMDMSWDEMFEGPVGLNFDTFYAALSEEATAALEEFDTTELSDYIAEAFAAGMFEGTSWADLESDYTSMIASIFSTDVDTSGATAAGASLGEAAADGVESTTGDAEAAGEAVADAAESGAETSYSGMYSAGEQAGNGFNSGLASKASSILATAKAIAAQTVSTIKNSLSIHSPSKVMQELGAYTGEGFDIGLQDAMRDAVATATGFAGQVTAAMTINADSSGLNDAATALTDAADSMAASDRSIVMTMDGKTVAQVNSGNVRTAAYARNKRIAIGVGTR